MALSALKQNSLHLILLACALGALAPAIHADTPAQARQAIQATCDRAAASYARRDLVGYMAIYSPDFSLRSVEGHKSAFRQVQSGMKIIFARNGTNTMSHCTVSQVVPQGDGARATVQWHYVVHRSRSASAPACTITRGYKAVAVWKKLPGGWKETSADVIRNDYLEYRG